MSQGPRRAAPPEDEVATMFDSIVERYDLVNTLLSLGLDRRWRRVAARAARARPGARVLDLGCGTGELGRLLAERAVVVGVDVSPRMLDVARRKGTVALVNGSAFRLPFRDGAFDAAVSAFVLRNLADLPGAFAETARVLVPGGRISFLDITGPSGPILRRAFDVYLRLAAGSLGAMAGRRGAYAYLVRSVGQIPERSQLVEMLAEAGFVECKARPLTAGAVTLFTAARASPAAACSGMA